MQYSEETTGSMCSMIVRLGGGSACDASDDDKCCEDLDEKNDRRKTQKVRAGKRTSVESDC